MICALPWMSTWVRPLVWPMFRVAFVVPETPRPPTSAVTFTLAPSMSVCASTTALSAATIVPFMFVFVW